MPLGIWLEWRRQAWVDNKRQRQSQRLQDSRVKVPEEGVQVLLGVDVSKVFEDAELIARVRRGALGDIVQR